MQQNLLPDHWLQNTLFDNSFLTKQRSTFTQDVAADVAWLKQRFDVAKFTKMTEAQLEEGFIRDVLSRLDWHLVPQQIYFEQGKQYKPDWSLVLNAPDVRTIIDTASPDSVQVLCESKRFTQALDTGKASKADNPHFQLLDYLTALRVRFGILTNGRFWRLYDTSRSSSSKCFLQIDLQGAMEAGDEELTQALQLFWHLFSRDVFQPPAVGVSTVVQQLADSEHFTLQVEENLQAVIYGANGEDSLFEIIGQAIAARNTKATMTEVYEHSLVLLFRLLFVVYFEDKNRSLLLSHPYYSRYSLSEIFRKLSIAKPSQFDGYLALKQLFQMIDEGAEDVDIPLFNGGLFDPNKAPMLRVGKLFDNKTLLSVLEKLLYKTQRGQTLFDVRRDYATISVTHLSRIYEGLLQFRFEKAAEAIWYVELKESGKTTMDDGYYDAYDYADLQKKASSANSKLTIKSAESVAKGQVYLKNSSNSRKTSASFYTPTSLSRPMVRSGIDHALEQAKKEGRSLWDLKILDNACGSGHFLVEALCYLAELALEQLAHDPHLQKQLAMEHAKIREQLDRLNLTHEPDDAQVLKRALLKRCIYGVDLNPFAVELARLSLWIDSFIFGTPLSFIEHHIQHGNALMGSRISEFKAFSKSTAQLFQENFEPEFAELSSVVTELGELQDTTAHDIEESKRIYHQEIEPRLNRLSRALSLHTMLDVLNAESRAMKTDIGRSAASRAASIASQTDLKDVLFGDSPNKDQRLLLAQVKAAEAEYNFFHYEVAFPEVFASDEVEHRGFDLIAGNPPWDKTKFTDAEFFSQFKSNYRTLSDEKKQELQQNFLSKPHIRSERDAQRRGVLIGNEYYKSRFPLNKGSGDGNLFRFFVEQNLGLLRKSAALCYVLPSALMFEEGSMVLRKHIFEHYQLKQFFAFENREQLFRDVDSRTKFAMMQIINLAPQVDAIADCAFYLSNPSELSDSARHIPYKISTHSVQRLSPEHMALMELRHTDDFTILDKCYTAFGPLNPDWIDFRRELDSSIDNEFYEKSNTQGSLPVYKGEMIWQFDADYAPAKGWISPAVYDERLQSKEMYRMAGDLGVPKADCSKFTKHVVFDRKFIRLAFRKIARDTDERTLVASLLPTEHAFEDSMYASIPKKYKPTHDGKVDHDVIPVQRLLFVLGLFNSLVMDWLIRNMVQINVNKTYVMRLPVPQPDEAELSSNPVYKEITHNALLLTLAQDWSSFTCLATQFGVKKTDLPATDKAKDLLRIRNDKLVCTLYGVTNAELQHMCGSFSGMAKKRPAYLAALLATD